LIREAADGSIGGAAPIDASGSAFTPEASGGAHDADSAPPISTDAADATVPDATVPDRFDAATVGDRASGGEPDARSPTDAGDLDARSDDGTIAATPDAQSVPDAVAPPVDAAADASPIADAGVRCDCPPDAMPPTGVACGTASSGPLGIGLVCAGPTEGFSDSPACGETGTYVFCSAPALAGLLCIESTGTSRVRACP
jgi:hypothetical protein